MSLRRITLAAIFALGLLVRPPVAALPGFQGPVVASAANECATRPDLATGLAQADAVFVGSVIFLENDGRWAYVTVDEPWRGAVERGSTVKVHGGGNLGLVTPVDRTFEMKRYLFAVGNGPDFFVDNACTVTTPWTDALARERPDGVEAAPGLAVASPIEDVNMDVFAPMAALLAALVVVVITYLIILRSRRRPPDWLR